MTATEFSKKGLANVKRALRLRYPNDKSSFLTEALAASCGYKSNAALLAALRAQYPIHPDFINLNAEAFVKRMEVLMPGWRTENGDHCFETLEYESPSLVLKTITPLFHRRSYKTRRQRGWRNLLVYGANAGLERRLFSLRPGDNRWEGANDEQRPASVFELDLGGIPALVSLRNAGFDEIAIHVACWPTKEGKNWIEVSNGDFLAGEVFASGWLERREGAWLQYQDRPHFRCRSARLDQVVALEISPQGYSDRGPFAS